MSGKASADSHTSAEPAVGYVPYLSLGMGVIRSADTRFLDGDDVGNAALYGSDGLYEFSGWELAPGRALRPFVGVLSASG